ncbi:MAG: methyl-accepting chemotaxis protein [Pelosinus sp.]|nr:methyl-accepting chemotaxis protein [Pelosinus sp.]
MNLSGIKCKLVLAFIITSFTSIFILSVYNVYDTIRQNQHELQDYRSTLFEQFDRSIKLEVETAHSLVKDIYSQQQKGLLSEADAKKRAADLVRNLRFDDDNYFWIDTTEGINVVLLGREVEGKSRTDLIDAKGKKIVLDFMEKGPQPGGGYTDYAFPKPDETQESPKRSYVLLFKPYNWIIGTGNWVDGIDKLVAAKAEANHKNLMVSISFSVGIGLLTLILAIFIASYISKRIAAPIVAIAENVQHVAEGNLRVEDLSYHDHGEIGVLAASFNSMKANIKQLINEVSTAAGQVAESSEQLTASSEQTALSTSQVAASISDVAANTNKQAIEVNHAADIIGQMSRSIQQVTDSVRDAVDISVQTAAAANAGEAAVGGAISQMASIERTVADSANVIAKLGSCSQEIGQIVNTISAIAAQTNLLALNAAIEAARAGEQGRGFSVVAEEVRKLAEQSQEASQQIAVLISQIQTDTEMAVKAMQSGTAEVKNGTAVVTAANTTFNEIAELISRVSSQISSISAATAELSGGSQSIVSAIHTIEDASKGVADETQTVSAASQQQSAAMQEIASSSQNLSELALKLKKTIANFKV